MHLIINLFSVDKQLNWYVLLVFILLILACFTLACVSLLWEVCFFHSY